MGSIDHHHICPGSYQSLGAAHPVRPCTGCGRDQQPAQFELRNRLARLGLLDQRRHRGRAGREMLFAVERLTGQRRREDGDPGDPVEQGVGHGGSPEVKGYKSAGRYRNTNMASRAAPIGLSHNIGWGMPEMEPATMPTTQIAVSPNRVPLMTARFFSGLSHAALTM